MNPDEKLEVLHEPEGTILLPGELFSTFFAENLTSTVNLKCYKLDW